MIGGRTAICQLALPITLIKLLRGSAEGVQPAVLRGFSEIRRTLVATDEVGLRHRVRDCCPGEVLSRA